MPLYTEWPDEGYLKTNNKLHFEIRSLYRLPVCTITKANYLTTFQCENPWWYGKYSDDIRTLSTCVEGYRRHCVPYASFELLPILSCYLVNEVLQIKPHEQKPSGVKSGDLGGQGADTPLSIQTPSIASKEKKLNFTQ